MSDFENLDFYELLGVPRSASNDEIKRAYRREISKYHPDRFASASPEEQEYASRRSQRLTEAYATLSDFASRSAYNLGQTPDSRRAGRTSPPSRPAPPPPPPQHRDHQAELYAQAREHLDAGRMVQAVGVLRQLQQINPFYRDAAELLAAAEERLRQRSPAPPRPRSARPLVLVAGAAGALAITALAVWSIGVRSTPTSARADSTAQAVATQPGDAPTAAQATTPTATTPPSPTQPPTAAPPTAAPPTAAPPTAAPPTAAPPTAAPPTPVPTPAFIEVEGTPLLEDAFASGGWASLSGTGWSVGYQGERYRIAVDAGIGTIWSYRSVRAQDALVAADVQVAAGEGGLVLRFLDSDNYLTLTLDPASTTYRLVQNSGGRRAVLAEGASPAILAGAADTNRLAARVQGGRVQIAVNGRLLTEVDAPGMPQSPRFGLVAVSGATPAEALFDNLTIRALE